MCFRMPELYKYGDEEMEQQLDGQIVEAVVGE